jgi:hypothetical protein
MTVLGSPIMQGQGVRNVVEDGWPYRGHDKVRRQHALRQLLQEGA